ncbi:unnamed protein product [Vitrella brassicaformis CCMP3155]|uniref:Uncharacterized protein n=1 Tax=Vitrella brassicaformis (strain CCMP3155) TaxID=1169540 RepID=A0A0G4GT73_VITBC|nr:unnamed protein product [Vitrella brassicaformis CCMP3155]|eukprot:CEM33892.1 unnamed protein product [Vitrella brassicaformis CCMP3155]
MARCRNHAKHYCRVCRNGDSDHRAKNCPILRAHLSGGRCIGYHQTSPAFGRQIRQTRVMQPSSSGAAGRGIYFAIRPDETERKARHKGCMVKAEIRMSNPKHVWQALSPNETYKSGVEIVVYNSEQVNVLSVQDM